jgi:hypothetical protein
MIWETMENPVRKKDTIKKFIAKNQKVDRLQLLESLRMTARLRRIGISGPGYRLGPQAGRSVQIVDDTESDPRTVILLNRY